MRTVYTVIRENSDVESPDEAQELAEPLFDEAGEYLYGGTGHEEWIGFQVQVSEDNGKTWRTVSEQAPK